jgi:membrane-associated phospholipid phosphatase
MPPTTAPPATTFPFTVNLWLILALLAACIALLIAESLGLKTTLQLNFKGDIKRESRWLAQYGQAVSAVVAAALIWQMDSDLPRRNLGAACVLIASFGAAIVGLLIKRLVGRVRPGREGAGKFLGPTWTHANWRESFPSNHTAAAVAMSAVLAQLYPQAASTFWTLAVLCAVLRYVLDAHWPSDVVGGVIVGYLSAVVALPLTARLLVKA